jgi:ceramide glucosyltransferase
VKGLEPQLYECLAATFRQTYPREKLTIYLCVSSSCDPAYPTLRQLLTDFPGFDAKIFVEQDDPNLTGGKASNLGPNPKIRNLSRGYREAKGDIVWIIDCNIWVGKGVLCRMVDKLCGFGPGGRRVLPYKFVHQLPLVVDNVCAGDGEMARGLSTVSSATGDEGSCKPVREEGLNKILRTSGGRLEEMFMASSHAKFYTAINTVCVAPCIVGKSNMFRRSHLNYLTSSSSPYLPGVDFFSQNICEDHLIGDLLWRKKVLEEEAGEKWGRHAMLFGDLAIQPMAGMSAGEYIARRIRWLRVRKWTVKFATLIEPGIESFLCSAYGSFAFTTLPWFHDTLHIPQTWKAFIIIWLLNVFLWMTMDYFVYAKLHSYASVEIDAATPSFARLPAKKPRRPLKEWVASWLGREILAIPIWIWAVLGGTAVEWRSQRFWVGMDMKVYELVDQKGSSVIHTARQRRNSSGKNKIRRD